MTGPPPPPSRHGRNSVRDIRIGGGLYLCRLLWPTYRRFHAWGVFLSKPRCVFFRNPVALGALTTAPMPAHDVLLLIMRCFWPTLERPQNAQPPRSPERPVKRGGDDYFVDAHDISLGQQNHPFRDISLPAGRARARWIDAVPSRSHVHGTGDGPSEVFSRFGERMLLDNEGLSEISQ